MSEASVGVLENAPIIYTPKPRELELQYTETSRLQKIKGSPRIWYVEIGESAGVFKTKYSNGKIKSDVENERAGYLISDIVGFGFVPTTVLRTIEGQEGSLQEIIENAQDLDEVDQDTFQAELYKYWLFRHVIRNPDGHDDNLVIKDGKLYSLDHEASFDSDPPDPSYFDIDRNYYGVKAPEKVVNIFKTFLSDNHKQVLLETSLAGLINSDDIEITMNRLKAFGTLLIEKGRINNKEDLSGKGLW